MRFSQAVCFILSENKAKIAALEKEMSDQKKKLTQQEGNVLYAIAQAKCRLKITIMAHETFLFELIRSLEMGSEKKKNL